MSRPSTSDISHTLQGWDTTLNAWRAVAFDAPLPPVEYANEAALPSAAAYDRCVAATQDGNLWLSDGAAWRPFQQTSGYSAAALGFGAMGRLVSRQEQITLAGATTATTIQFPNGSIRLGVTARVTADVTGATSWDLGDGTDVDLYAAGKALPAGTTVDRTDRTAAIFSELAAAQTVVATANGSNFTGGTLRVVIHYLELIAPTS